MTNTINNYRKNQDGVSKYFAGTRCPDTIPEGQPPPTGGQTPVDGVRPPRLCQNSKNRNDTAIYSGIVSYRKVNTTIYKEANEF
jgi:hypothetical protein